MENKQVLYYLGAGASQQAIPTLNSWKDELEDLKDFAGRMKLSLDGFGAVERTSLEETHSVMLADLTYVLSEIQNQHTVDTFAKKLYVLNKVDKLLALKRVISLFILYCQTITQRFERSNDKNGIRVVSDPIQRKTRDPRYETFFSYLFSRNDTDIPSHVRVISWNYDSQLEGALKSFTDDSGTIIAKITRNQNQIYKVNGTIGTIFDGKDDRPLVSQDFGSHFTNNMEDWLLLLKHYQNLLQLGNDKIGIKYAWESESLAAIKLRLEKLQLNKVSAVVVVGYSFPFFNREIDELILRALQAQRVDFYLQYPTHEEYLNVLDRLNGFEIAGRPFVDAKEDGRKNSFYISDLSTFYIPYGV